MERTLVLLKPDAVQRGLVGRIVARFEAKGLKIVGMKMLQVPEALARRLYAEHEGAAFHEPLVEFLTASPSVAAVIEGVDATRIVRQMLGPTFGPDAPAGTVRGDFGLSRRYNLAHGSDSPASAAREIPLLFDPDELLDYARPGDEWVYARSGDEII